jgi:inorganic pyrophosphatase
LNGRVGTTPVYPLTLVEARAIGLMTITDREEVDHKVVAVHVNDPDFDIYHEARELPQHRLTVLKRFFMDYKVLENKEVIVGEILPAKKPSNNRTLTR